MAAFASFWLRGQNTSPDDVVKLIQAVMTPVIGLAGAVTGFYYAERQGRRASAAED